MRVVQIADNFACGGRKILGGKILQESGTGKSAMDIGHPSFDETAELELMPILGDFDGAYLAGPIIYVLEQVLVNSPKVGEVEQARRDSLQCPLGYKTPLDKVEPFLVGKRKLIPENCGAGITVGIGPIHSAASEPIIPRM